MRTEFQSSTSEANAEAGLSAESHIETALWQRFISVTSVHQVKSCSEKTMDRGTKRDTDFTLLNIKVNGMWVMII